MVSDPRFSVMGVLMGQPGGKDQITRRAGQRILYRERLRPFRRFSMRLITPAPARETDGEFQIVQIVVRDNNVDQALKALKKKMQREGVFREMKSRTAFEKPSEAKARRKAEAVRRARKLARKRAQREGLLPKA
jgi:small subunit ribosomal protein S21